MAFDLNKIFTTTLESVEQAVGGAVGDLVADGKKAVGETPTWINDFFGNFFKGFTSTPGGQAAVGETGAAVLSDTLKDFFSKPIGWAVIAVAAILVFKLVKK